jgi:hypothetical protein
LPAFDPPLRAKLAIGDAHARLAPSRIAIGALEQSDIDTRIRVNGAQPMIPGQGPASSAAPPTAGGQVQPVSSGRGVYVGRSPYRQAPAARYRRSVVRP